MSFGQGNPARKLGSGLGGAPGCCSRKIGGRAGGRRLAKPAPRPGVAKPGGHRPGFGRGKVIRRPGLRR